MGKKMMVNEAAYTKVSRNSEKQLHSLMKGLKPKVYITDASSFKSLVQELTGNAALVPSVPSSRYSPSLSPEGRVLTSFQETAGEGSVQAQAPPIPLHVEDQDRHGDSRRSTRVKVQAPIIESSRIMGDIDHQMSLVGLEALESWLLEDVDYLAVPVCGSSCHAPFGTLQ